MTGTHRYVAAELGVHLRTGYSPVGLELTDLLGVAVRQNPRRAHLLVSTVLGKHIPTDPHLVHGAGLLLGGLIGCALRGEEAPASWTPLVRAALDGDASGLMAAFSGGDTSCKAVVLGFAETATALGHSAADALGAPYYLHSTRRRVPGVPEAGTFEEGHSHASTHYLAPAPKDVLQQDLPLVLVDDEFSTGRTLMATIEALHRQFPRRRYLAAALVDLRDDDARREMKAFAERLGVLIQVVSLVSGEVSLPETILTDATRLLIGLPTPSDRPTTAAAPVRRIEIPWPATVPEGGRHGFTTADRHCFETALAAAVSALRPEIASADRVLVLGTEEFMYLPLRIAIGLAADHRVRYQTTTRSPVFPIDHPEYPVRRRIRFPDPEGDTVADRFLNNADHTAGSGDVVLLLVDGPADTEALMAPGGLADMLARLGTPVVVAALTGTDPRILVNRPTSSSRSTR